MSLFVRVLSTLGRLFPRIEFLARHHLRVLWQEAVAGEQAIAADFADLKEAFEQRFQAWISNPRVLRELFGGLRAVKPIFVAPRLAVVSSYADVLDALSDDESFSVTEIYAAKMQATSGAFILGMENTPQYQREASILRRAARREDLPRIRAFVAECADQLLAAAEPAGRIDAVGGYSRLVPVRLVQHYFGVPGPDEPTLLRWLQTIFHEIFLNLANDAKIREAAAVSSREMSAYLNSLIGQRKTEIAGGQSLRDDFLTRLLKMQQDPTTALDDDGIRRNIGGVIAGAVDTTSKAIAHAVDQLLQRPDALHAAQQAAAADDDPLLAAHVFEALRFNPQNPILLRHCRKARVLGRGTSRETQIPEGITVCLGTLSAMFDPADLVAPEEFRVSRPAHHYIHFGHGMHTCFGEHVNRVQVPEVIKRLLRLKGLRRAPGPEGELQYDGPFPSKMVVVFDA